MLELKNVSYAYTKNKLSVENVCAAIDPGIYLLLGENGAGKTTLLHLMCGLRFPSSGECLIDGTAAGNRSPETLRKIFMLGENFECPFSKINEMARHHGAFYPDFSFDLLKANLEDFGLTGDERIRTMSLGMRRKTYAAYALALGTDYLLLDEPTNGMDIDSKKIFRRLLSRCIGEGQAAVVATHNVHDLGNMIDHVLVMRHGRLRLAMTVWELTRLVAFVDSPEPVEGAIYQEPEAGRFKAIIPNEHGIETDIDYPLLYSAVMAPVGDLFIDFLNNFKEKDNER